MAITKMRFSQFTAFAELDFIASPGINVILGANGTGKTHLMKVAYVACDVSKTKIDFAGKLVCVFMPSLFNLGQLVRQQPTDSPYSDYRVEVFRGDLFIHDYYSSHVMGANEISAAGMAASAAAQKWYDHPVEGVYIPSKEVLAHAPGFRSLYSQNEIHFERFTPIFSGAPTGSPCTIQ